ncbi:MAG: hypothetical protein JWR80_7124 [Bradyrhizobium sp.]|nr:hypothetical protein [Bradyrhizobium sp.]
MVELVVKFVPGGATEKSWITIDDIDVNIGAGNKGKVEVGDDPDHSVSMWFSGMPGSTISYEILQETYSLVKGKATISSGQRLGYLSGGFKLHAA